MYSSWFQNRDWLPSDGSFLWVLQLQAFLS